MRPKKSPLRPSLKKATPGESPERTPRPRRGAPVPETAERTTRGRRDADERPDHSEESDAPVRHGPRAAQPGARAPAAGPRRGAGGGRFAAPPVKPERLHKVLAQAGIGSRREMEEWIAAGRININGETAQVGQLVGPDDRVKVNGKLVNLRFVALRTPRVLMYHKPEGEIVSRDDPDGRPSVFDALPRMRNARWIAVGRLDFNTSGLLLFTTSGDLANKLMHPSAQLVREYAVRVLGDLSEEAKTMLTTGVQLDDGPASFASLVEAGGEGANQWYKATLFEGRNREVRRMFEAVGCTVSRLIRVQYGPFVLPPRLLRGKCKELNEDEVKRLMRDLELPGKGDRPRQRRP